MHRLQQPNLPLRSHQEAAHLVNECRRLEITDISGMWPFQKPPRGGRKRFRTETLRGHSIRLVETVATGASRSVKVVLGTLDAGQ